MTVTLLWAAGLAVVNLVWVALVLAGLPGNWLMLITTLALAWYRWQPDLPADQQMFHPATLIVLVVLALVGELLEFLAGFAGARRSGSSWWGSLAGIGGAMVGAVAGTMLIPLPLVGTLMGAGIGAFAGTAIVERHRGQGVHESLKRGAGASVGQLLGIFGKLLMGVAIYVISLVAAVWP